MNEEIRNNEIREEELEDVSGGVGVFAALKNCPKCGGVMVTQVHPKHGVGYSCRMCGYYKPA